MIALIYDLNKKKFVDKKFNEKSSTKKIQNKNDEQKINKKLLVDEIQNEINERKINKKSFVDEFNAQSKIIKLIKAIYSNNVILQQLIKTKKLKKQRVLMNITKTKIKLKLKKCKIRDDLF